MSVETETRSPVTRRPARARLRTALWSAAVVAAVLTAVTRGVYWHAQWATRQFARAQAALADGDFDEVERVAERLEGNAAFEPHWHFLRAALLLQRGENLRALDEFGHAVEHPELRLDTLTLSGQAAYKAGYLRAAVGLLNQATQLSPDSLPALRWLASAYYDLGLNDGTIITLARIAQLDVRDPRPHRLMGLIYKDFENYAAAIEHYRESLRRSEQQPDHQQILLELADCEIKLQRLEEALATLANSHANPERWVREAECHYGLGRLDEAETLLDTALRYDPAQLSGLLLAGTIASERGNEMAAIESFTHAVVAWPKDYVAHFKLAQALRRAGREQQADDHTRIAAQIKKAREEFSKLHEKAADEPNNADVRCQLAVVARQLGRPDLARVWFRAALAIDPCHGETLRQLAGDLPPDAQQLVPSADQPAGSEPR